jgi:hypothetical protein
MAAFGSGSELWRVDVVLRRGTAESGTEARVLDRLTEWLTALPTRTDEEVHPSLAGTYSYDLSAPEGEVGVSCWVRADSLGQAAQLGFDTVARAFVEVVGRPADLWDLRLIPRSAITDGRSR